MSQSFDLKSYPGRRQKKQTCFSVALYAIVWCFVRLKCAKFIFGRAGSGVPDPPGERTTLSETPWSAGKKTPPPHSPPYSTPLASRSRRLWLLGTLKKFLRAPVTAGVVVYFTRTSEETLAPFLATRSDGRSDSIS